MDNVSQRLGLQQPDLFGLKYVSRRSYPKIRWVDLERPLKKQLDKYSTEPYLFLGVIFYVTDVSLLEDEVTRYHYFLQLKMDVVEGRLRCNHEQAIVLASYSLQVENKTRISLFFQSIRNHLHQIYSSRLSLVTTIQRSTRQNILKTFHFFRSLLWLSLRSIETTNICF